MVVGVSKLELRLAAGYGSFALFFITRPPLSSTDFVVGSAATLEAWSAN